MAAIAPVQTDPSAPVDDRVLVEQARVGNQAAFRQLVERYQGRLYAKALSMVRDPDEARDVVQDAFVRAYRNLATFAGDSAFYTWIYRIGVNLCIDRARQKARAARVEFDEAIDREDDEASDTGISPRRLGFDPAAALRDREIRERVQGALGQLSPNHRAIILLREVDGLAYKEIAEVMDCSEGTVMSRLFHARKHLQELLRPLVDDDEGDPNRHPTALPHPTESRAGAR